MADDDRHRDDDESDRKITSGVLKSLLDRGGGSRKDDDEARADEDGDEDEGREDEARAESEDDSDESTVSDDRNDDDEARADENEERDDEARAEGDDDDNVSDDRNDDDEARADENDAEDAADDAEARGAEDDAGDDARDGGEDAEAKSDDDTGDDDGEASDEGEDTDREAEIRAEKADEDEDDQTGEDSDDDEGEDGDNDDEGSSMLSLLGFVLADEARHVGGFDGLQAAETADARVVAVLGESFDPDDAIESLTTSQERLIELAGKATVLPVAAGTMVPRGGAIAAELDRVIADLQRMQGRVEARIIGEYDEDRLVERIADRVPRGPGDDRIELGRRVAAEIETERARDEGRVMAAIADAVADHKRRRPGEGRMCDLSVMIHRDDVEGLNERLRALVNDDMDHVSFRVIAPLPLYNFAR